MGKAGRMACIFVPMALTVVALVLLALLGMAQTNQNSYYLSNLYFLRANTTGAANHPELLQNAPNNQTPSADIDGGKVVLYNSYSVGLWNYCAGGGQVGNQSSGTNASDPASSVAFCSDRQIQFGFNPETAWGLPDTFTTKFFSSQLSGLLDKYENGLAKAIGPLYILTVGAAAVSTLLGIGAIFSRIGSMVTSLAIGLTTTLAFAFASVTTFAYFSLEGAFNTALDKEGIQFHHGAQAFAYVWISAITLLVAGAFWTFSACCVSGRSSRKDHRDRAAGSSYGSYQRMDHSPTPGYGQHQQAVPLTAYGGHSSGGNAYEPYRHA